MKLSVIQVPYDSGHFARRMGRGPLHVVERGLLDQLGQDGHDADLVEVRLPEDFRTEVGTAIELQRRVDRAVRTARRDGRLPLVLTGNCSSAALGVSAGLSDVSAGVLWFDAHGDFNTPDTSPSGFFDGMALSVLTGSSWKGLVDSFSHFRTVSERRVILLGARDLDPEEEQLLRASEVIWIEVSAWRGEPTAEDLLRRDLDAVTAPTGKLYLHVDLDVLDSSVARVNPFAAPGGLELEELVRIIEVAGERTEIAAAAITSYDPDYDEDGRAFSAYLAVARAILGDG